MPDRLREWNIKSVAECLPVSEATYKILWEAVNNCKNFIPSGRVRAGQEGLDRCWARLTEETRRDILRAFDEEYTG